MQSGMRGFDPSHGSHAFQSFCRASQETRERAGNPCFSRILFGLRTPALPNLRRKSPKVSGRFREYSRFGETIGGDGFDQESLLIRLSVSSTSGVRISGWRRDTIALVRAETRNATRNPSDATQKDEG
jgi:hypothetical protein